MLTRLMNQVRTARASGAARSLPTPLTLLAGFLLSLPLAALPGCQDNRHEGEAWLSVGTAELRRDVRVGDPIRNRDEFNLIRVAVPVRNVTEKQLYVQGVMTFYDHYGNEVGVPIHKTITIPADQVIRFEGNSTTPQAETFRLALNYPRVE